MPRKKKEPQPEVVVSEVTEPTKIRYKKYWVDLLDDCYSVIQTIELPPDAPVRNVEDKDNPKLTIISECATWDYLEYFHLGSWVTAKLLVSPRKFTFRVEMVVTKTSFDTEETVVEEIRKRYGRDANVTIGQIEDLAEVDE